MGVFDVKAKFIDYLEIIFIHKSTQKQEVCGLEYTVYNCKYRNT